MVVIGLVFTNLTTCNDGFAKKINEQQKGLKETLRKYSPLLISTLQPTAPNYSLKTLFVTDA